LAQASPTDHAERSGQQATAEAAATVTTDAPAPAPSSDSAPASATKPAPASGTATVSQSGAQNHAADAGWAPVRAASPADGAPARRHRTTAPKITPPRATKPIGADVSRRQWPVLVAALSAVAG
jgi:hypothetical protein